MLMYAIVVDATAPPRRWCGCFDPEMRQFWYCSDEVKMWLIGKYVISVNMFTFIRAILSSFSENASDGQDASVLGLIGFYYYRGLNANFCTKKSENGGELILLAVRAHFQLKRNIFH